MFADYFFSTATAALVFLLHRNHNNREVPLLSISLGLANLIAHTLNPSRP
jgi:hypothetical protein